MSAICPGSEIPRRNSATCGMPRDSTMFSRVARYSRANSMACGDGWPSWMGSICTQVAEPVPGTPTPTTPRCRPRITTASAPPRTRPSSSTLAIVPTRA